MKLTTNQLIAVVMVILGVLVGSTAQLTDLMGPGVTKTIVSLASLANTMLSGIMVVLTGQTAQINNVRAMAIGPASDQASSAQSALINATSAIAADPSIPTSSEATHTLIDATIRLPQVQTIITDQKTADNSRSASVVSARELINEVRGQP